jgi:hypothetical protein
VNVFLSIGAVAVAAVALGTVCCVGWGVLDVIRLRNKSRTR